MIAAGPRETGINRMPFNTDINVRQKFYSDDYLHVHTINGEPEIFRTVQGEGPYVGIPAIFVRLAGCNLGEKKSCPWCDTSFSLLASVKLTPDDVSERVFTMMDNDRPLLVITGGEPLMQPAVPKLVHNVLIRKAFNPWTVQVETNGYFWSDKLYKLFSGQFAVVLSPKVNAQGRYPESRVFNSVLKSSVALKIVIDHDEQSPYHNVPDFAISYAADGKSVYLSPVMHYERQPEPGEVTSLWNVNGPLDRTKSQASIRRALTLCHRFGFRLSLQTHLMAGVA